MNTIVKFFGLAMILLIAINAESSILDEIKTPEEDFYLNSPFNVVSYNKKKENKHAGALVWIRKNEDTQADIYEIVENGHGHFDKYKDITWKTETHFDIKKGLMRVLRSTKKIYGSSGEHVISIVKEYDYDMKQVSFEKMDAEGQQLDRKNFPIQGPVCDDTNLTHFVRGIFMTGQAENYPTFYLLTNEPKMYKVNTRFKQNEILSLPGGDREAVKLQLLADLGVLTEVAAKIVSPTYVWIGKEYPHNWLQYEGRESGRHSVVVRAIADHTTGEEI